MGGVLDDQSGVVGAVMVGQFGLSVEDSDAGGAGDQRQRLSDVGVGNRVEIAVEADVGGLAGADDVHQVGLEGMGGQRQQAGLLLGPDVGDGAVALVGVRPPVGDLVAPAAELGVQRPDGSVWSIPLVGRTLRHRIRWWWRGAGVRHFVLRTCCGSPRW